jgi:glycosyltransferase involved in cell wall biosynthesis
LNSYSKRNKICAVIPFYNEHNSIKEIVNQTLSFVDFVIAVNDGSTDGSINAVPQSENVILLSFKQNSGKGFALKAGFEKSISLNTDYTITLDADLQHPPEIIPKLISELAVYDIVIGNRLRNISAMPLQRIASNKITSFLLSFKTKIKLLDTQCGFRAFKTDILKYILPSFNGYEAESEILVKAAKKNYKIGFIDIPTIYGNEQSKMKSFQAIYGFLRVLFN